MAMVGTKGGAIITGDNLQIMKAYRGVPFDLVYLDPPYNAGSGSVTYQDKWKSWEEWAAWLEPRLVETKRLMAPDGLLFASMGHKGVFDFGVLLNKVFGRASRLGFFGRRTVINSVSNPKVQVWDREFVFMFGRGKNSHKNASLEVVPRKIKQRGANGIPPGIVSHESNRWKRSRYPLYGDPDTEKVSGKPFKNSVEIWPKYADGAPSMWLTTKENLLKRKLVCRRAKNGKPNVYIDYSKGSTVKKLRFDIGAPISAGTRDLKREGFPPRAFATPKPVSLLKHLISLHKSKSARILDPFAGSGTTAVAAVDLNREDGGSREFFLIEENEAVVSDLTKPRVEGALKKW